MSQISALMEGVTVEQLDFPPLVLGEGPHWIESLQALMLADVYSNILRRRFFPSGRHQVLHLGETGGPNDLVTAAIPVEDEADLYVAVTGKDLSFLRWTTRDPDDHNTTAKSVHTTSDFGFNDAKCDPQGRLWAGTVSLLDEGKEATEANASALYRMDSNLVVTKWAPVFLSNGLAWSLDRRNFYFVDTHTRTIDVFDYDDQSGAISNRRLLLDYAKADLRDQVPDGMAIDVDGNLWVASFGSHQVICLNPRSGRILRRVRIPAKNPTSVCWGGPDYATLFVTSGTLFMTPEEVAANPSSGRTFAVTGLGTKGLPAARFRVNSERLRARGVVV